MFTSRRIATMGGDKFRDEYSLAFDGTNDYINCGNPSTILDDTVGSISIWVKTPPDDNLDIVLSGSNDGDAASDLTISRNSAEKLWFFVRNDSTYLLNVKSAATILNDVWYHFVIAVGSSSNTMYINGSLAAVTYDNGDATTQKWFSDVGGADTLLIGARKDSGGFEYYWNGNISEVAYYDKQLSSSEVKTIYNGREPYNHKEGVASGNLKAWYRMGDGTLDSRHLDETDTQVISDMVTPTLGASLWDAGADVFTSGTYNWSAYSNNTIENDSNTLKITYVDNASGAAVDLKDGHDLSSDLIVGKVYKIKFDAKVNTGSVDYHVSSASGSDDLTWAVTNTSFETFEGYFLCNHATNCYFRTTNMGSGEIAWVDNISIQEVGGNAGVMQNMSATDIEGDTP